VSEFIDRLSDGDIAALRQHLKLAITTSETISSAHLDRLQNRLGVPVVEEYGCSEVDIICFCCPAGGRHTAAEDVLVEVVRQGDEPDGFGHVIVTDLNNTLMPVIRYLVGDLAPLERPLCKCGRGWACIGPVLGRAQNQFISIDGGRRRVHSQFVVYLIERLFDKGLRIARFQIVQERPDLLVLRLVRTGVGDVDVRALEGYLAREGRGVLGSEMHWEVAIVSAAAIETTAAGKFQHFISHCGSGLMGNGEGPGGQECGR
jgi:phenylacetate-CoA ligase